MFELRPETGRWSIWRHGYLRLSTSRGTTVSEKAHVGVCSCDDQAAPMYQVERCPWREYSSWMKPAFSSSTEVRTFTDPCSAKSSHSSLVPTSPSRLPAWTNFS